MRARVRNGTAARLRKRHARARLQPRETHRGVETPRALLREVRIRERHELLREAVAELHANAFTTLRRDLPAHTRAGNRGACGIKSVTCDHESERFRG